MAFTRKFLAALGIDSDKVDEIIQAHTEVTDALKEDRDKYKANAEKLPAVEDELKALKDKMAGDDPYKEKYEKLKKEHDEYKKDVEAKATAAKKESAFKAMLKEIGIPEKRIDSVLKVSDVSTIEFDEEGKIKDGEKLKESLKSEWGDFIATTKIEGAKSATPPANTGKTTMTKEQIRAISDPVERQAKMLENPSLFGLPENK
jgi:chromosome condensin MukBEF complex kleisin-like MukF subunit